MKMVTGHGNSRQLKKTTIQTRILREHLLHKRVIFVALILSCNIFMFFSNTFVCKNKPGKDLVGQRQSLAGSVEQWLSAAEKRRGNLMK